MLISTSLSSYPTPHTYFIKWSAHALFLLYRFYFFFQLSLMQTNKINIGEIRRIFLKKIGIKLLFSPFKTNIYYFIHYIYI